VTRGTFAARPISWISSEAQQPGTKIHGQRRLADARRSDEQQRVRRPLAFDGAPHEAQC
jgi:hypothetical protein